MDSTEKMFMQKIKKYPVLSEIEQLELIKKYKENNDQESYQKLINHNLRLCIFVAKNYKNMLNSITFMDLIQENIITLMKAINLYNINETTKLSSYAITAMERNIKRIIDNQDKMIRKPVNMEILISKYKKYLYEYQQKNNSNPSNEEIKEEFNLTDNQLKFLNESMKINVDSLNKKIAKEESNSEIIDFMSSVDNSYQNIEEEYDLSILKEKCKKILNKEEYYIIYYRYINEERKTLDKIANEFNLTRERIRQKEKNALIKLKNKLKKININLKSISKDNYNQLSIEQIIIFNELKKKLTNEEYYLLYLTIIMNKDIENNNYFNKLDLDKSNKEDLKNFLLQIYYEYNQPKNIEKLLDIYHKQYTNAQILDLNIKINMKELIDYQELDQYFRKIDFSDLKNSTYYNSLSIHNQNLIKKYYQINDRKLTKYQKQNIERELTLNKLGYLKIERPLYTKDQYKKIYNKYEFLLNNNQKKLLKDILFSNNNLLKIENSTKNNLLRKLVTLDLKIDNFFGNKITSYQINEVLKKHNDLLTEQEKNILYNYYGVNNQQKSIKILAEENNQTYEEMHDKIFNLKNRILYKYYNITSSKKENLSIEDNKLYRKYLENPQYEFSNDTKMILDMYLNGQTYKEISEYTKFGRAKVSNIIVEGLRKCEFYKYKIITPFLISEEDINKIFKDKNYSKEEQNIIIKRYINSEMTIEISKELQQDKRKIQTLNDRFYIEYLKLKCPNISLENYESELYKHPSESILTEEEKKIVSLKYGLKSKYNPNSRKFSNIDISKKLSISERNCKNRQTYLNNKIRERILNLKQPSYGLIPRCDLKKILQNKNLPISDKEKYIICSTNELYDYPYMSETQLAEQYNERGSSIKRRYNRAILAIYKFQENLIDKKIDYNEDILPISKYFSEVDRKLLKMHYDDNLTNQQIQKEINESKDTTIQKIRKIKLDVAEILNDEITAKKFDFDYARKVIDRKDLPLYVENKDLVIKIYKMITGENSTKKYTVPEVKEKLNLERGNTAILNDVYNVMIAVEKYKRKIKKTKQITYNQILDYYNNQENIPNELIKSIEKIIYTHNYQTKNYRCGNNISTKLTYEIIKNNTKEKIKIEDIDRNDSIKLLKSKDIVLSNYCIQNLKNYFKVNERELMSGREKMKVLNLLQPVYKKINISTCKNLQKS